VVKPFAILLCVFLQQSCERCRVLARAVWGLFRTLSVKPTSSRLGRCRKGPLPNQLMLRLSEGCAHRARRSRKRRVATQFEDLQSCYLQLRRCRRAAAGASAAGSDAGAPGASPACSGGDGGGVDAVAVEAVAGASSQDRLGAEDVAQPAAAAGAPGAAAAAGAPGAAGGAGTVGAVLASGGLAEFSRMLSVFTHCSKLRVRPAAATRSHGGGCARLCASRGSSVRS